MASVSVCVVCVCLTFIPQTFIIDACSVENIMQVLELERKKRIRGLFSWAHFPTHQWKNSADRPL